jgi:hypothetical protein
MTAWDVRFTQHPVHQDLADLLAEVRKLKLPRKAADVEEARQRLDRVLTHVQAVLKAADPELTVPAVLDGVQASIPQLRAQVEYAEDEEDPSYLSTANQHADSMLQSVAGITPRAVGQEDVARLQEAATNFRQSVGQLVRHVREEAEGLANDIEAQRTATAELLAEVRGRRGASIKSSATIRRSSPRSNRNGRLSSRKRRTLSRTVPRRPLTA